jgi:hypothetical protein
VHANNPCVAVKSGTPGTKFGFPFVKAVPGARFEGDPEEIATVGAGTVVLEFHEDCTHFVSCCIGRPGGGLSMPNPFFGPYGIVPAPQFLSIRHIALYIGEGKIVCHSRCRIDAPFDGISFAKRRYFHVIG